MGVAYILAILYFFIGIFVFLNKMMKKTIVSDPETGKDYVKLERVFSIPIANIIIVLGSFIPILSLAIIDYLQRFFIPPISAGPGTFLGSSAFNILAVTGVIINHIIM